MEIEEVDEIADKLSSIESTGAQRTRDLTTLLENCMKLESETLAVSLKSLEKLVFELADLLAEQNAAQLANFMETLGHVFAKISKAKSAKLITGVIRNLSRTGTKWALQVPIDLCVSTIERCREKNRKFLRHRVEQNLAELYFRTRQYATALSTISTLLHEIKRLDDKLLLVELHMLESRIQHSLRNIPKAKAALTASRASASSVYVNPDLQGDLDMMGGVIATEEQDYRTGFSYFFEAFEGCRLQKDDSGRTKKALNYMLLSKIMARKYKDVNSLISSKSALEYRSPEVDCLHSISKACKKRSIKELESVIEKFPIEGDTLLEAKLTELKSTLEEENLLKLLEPYSKVQIEHISKLIDLPVDHVTRKLSHMILDKKLLGILDQGAGAVIMYEKEEEDQIFEFALDTLEALEEVVDQLILRVKLRW